MRTGYLIVPYFKAIYLYHAQKKKKIVTCQNCYRKIGTLSKEQNYVLFQKCIAIKNIVSIRFIFRTSRNNKKTYFTVGDKFLTCGLTHPCCVKGCNLFQLPRNEKLSVRLLQ